MRNVCPPPSLLCVRNVCPPGDKQKENTSKHPKAKIKKCLQRLIKPRNWKDSFRELHPTKLSYSRFYENSRAEVSVAFSDHPAHILEYFVKNNLQFLARQKIRPTFKIKAKVIRDKVFKEKLMDCARVRAFMFRARASLHGSL